MYVCVCMCMCVCVCVCVCVTGQAVTVPVLGGFQWCGVSTQGNCMAALMQG